MDSYLSSLSEPTILGPLTEGHYISVGTGLGFYVDEAAFQLCQRAANATGKVEFLGVSREGEPLLGTREEILAHPRSAGGVAWIGPNLALPECGVCHYLGEGVHAPGCTASKPRPKEIAIFAEHTRRSGERAWKIESDDDRTTDDAFWTFARQRPRSGKGRNAGKARKTRRCGTG